MSQVLSIWQDSSKRAKGLFAGCLGIASLLFTFAPVWDTPAGAAISGVQYGPSVGVQGTGVTFTGLEECIDTEFPIDVAFEIDTQAGGVEDRRGRAWSASGTYQIDAPAEFDFLAGQNVGPSYTVTVWCVTADEPDVISPATFPNGFTYVRPTTTSTTAATTSTTGATTSTTTGATTSSTAATTSTTGATTSTTTGDTTSTTTGATTSTTTGDTTSTTTGDTTSTTAASSTTAAPACTVSDTTLTLGQSVSVACGGFAPGSTVAVDLLSDPVRLTTLTANASGQVTGSVRIPLTTAAGNHEVRFTGTAADGTALVRSVAVTVSRELPRTGGDSWTLFRYSLLLVGFGLLAAGRSQLVAARVEP